MRKLQFNKSLALQLVAFCAFAVMAMSSASTKEERKANRDAFERGWEIGRALREGASVDEIMTDSLPMVAGDEMAEVPVGNSTR